MRAFLQSLLAHRLWQPTTRALLAAAYLTIALASLAPKDLRPTSGVVPGAIEHLAAYFVLGVLGAVILRGQISWSSLALFNIAFAGALEAGQLFVPGRVANVIDFAASAIGSLLGILAVHAVHRAKNR